MAGVMVGPGVLIDRYHRGAIVLVGSATFAVPEQMVRLLEKVSRVTATYQPQDELEEEAARELVARGILLEAP